MKLNKVGEFNATLVFPDNLAEMFYTSGTGSDGLILNLNTDEGSIQHVAWLTSKAHAKTVENLSKVFGFDGDFDALAHGQPFPRTRCSIVTELEEFTASGSGKTMTSCKVKWLNPPSGIVGGGDVGGVLSRLKALEGKPIAQINEEQCTTNPNDPEDAFKW